MALASLLLYTNQANTMSCMLQHGLTSFHALSYILAVPPPMSFIFRYTFPDIVKRNSIFSFEIVRTVPLPDTRVVLVTLPVVYKLYENQEGTPR